MKLHPHNSRLVISNIAYNEQVVQYSAKLQELLYLLLDESQLDDNTRISIEASLAELTTSLPISKHDNYVYDSTGSSNRKFKNRQFLPHPKSTDLTYPNNYLSKILIDNFDSLIRFSKTYFNLSLASQITKYTVELIYQLYYWEMVHLVFINPSMVDFLVLLKFEIINTSFGPIIRPPDTYLNDNMLQGLQYPYPYPFYNYSYHSFNGRIENDKFNKVKITPYIDITLKNYSGATQTKRKRGRKPKSEANTTGRDTGRATPVELSRTISETSDYESKDKRAKTELNTPGIPLPYNQGQTSLQQPQISSGSIMASTSSRNNANSEASRDVPPPLTTFLPNARNYPQPHNQQPIFGNNQSPQLASISPNTGYQSVHLASGIPPRTEISGPTKGSNISVQGMSQQQLPSALPIPIHQQYANSPYQRIQVPNTDNDSQLVGRNSENIRIPPIASESASPGHMERQPMSQQQQQPSSESIARSGSVNTSIPMVNPIANYRGSADNVLPSISKLRSDQQSPTSLSSISGSPDTRSSPTTSTFSIPKNYQFSKPDQYQPPGLSSGVPIAIGSSQQKSQPPPPQPQSQPHSQPQPQPQPQLQLQPQQHQQSEYVSNFDSPQSNISSTATPPAVGSSSNAYQEQTNEEKTKKQKSGVIHQCHLTDPNTMAECMKIFYGKNELLRHQEFVHATKKKIYKCIYCAKNGAKVQSYPRHDSLARHIRRKHGITGKENKMAVNYAKENVEIIDPDQLVTKQHDFQEHSTQVTAATQVAPPQQISYSHPIRYGRPAPIPSYLQHRRSNLFPQTHRLNKGQQRAYAIAGSQPNNSQVAIPQSESQPQAQSQPQPLQPQDATGVTTSVSFPAQSPPPVRSGTMLPSPREIVNSPPYGTTPINVASTPIHPNPIQIPHLQEGTSNSENPKQ
ncbi:Filamentous growth regulator 15 [Candida tropicalis]